MLSQTNTRNEMMGLVVLLVALACVPFAGND